MKIKRKDYPVLFGMIDEFVQENSFREHRRDATFYTKSIVYIPPMTKVTYGDTVEDLSLIYGNWETNMYVRSDNYVDWGDIEKLTKVELVEEELLVTKRHWVKV